MRIEKKITFHDKEIPMLKAVVKLLGKMNLSEKKENYELEHDEALLCSDFYTLVKDRVN